MKTSVGTVLAGLLVVAFTSTASAAPKQAKRSAAVKRGEYLVTVAVCTDCHTPFKSGPPGPTGPEKDEARLLSGHPETLVMPPAPRLDEPWIAAGSFTFTAWSGPWGVSFSANLTPDTDTGLGPWTEQNFVEAMRTGRHQGRGRQILPPMPWQNYAKLSDADLKAVFAYLRTSPAVPNRVPDPIAPAAAQAAPGAAPGGTGTTAPPPEGAPPQGTPPQGGSAPEPTR